MAEYASRYAGLWLIVILSIGVIAIVGSRAYFAASPLGESRLSRSTRSAAIAMLGMCGLVVTYVSFGGVRTGERWLELVPLRNLLTVIEYQTSTTAIQILWSFVGFAWIGLVGPIALPRLLGTLPRIAAAAFSLSVVTELVQFVTASGPAIIDSVLFAPIGAVAAGLVGIRVAQRVHPGLLKPANVPTAHAA